MKGRWQIEQMYKRTRTRMRFKPTHLADDEKILPLHHAVLDHGLDALPHLGLVAVEERPVDVPVAGRDGYFHRFCDLTGSGLTRQGRRSVLRLCFAEHKPPHHSK